MSVNWSDPLTPGSLCWWSQLAYWAAVRAWCCHMLGMSADARKWMGVCADCSAALTRVTR